jgi:hypothetical protein
MHRLNLDIQSYTESDLIRLFSLKNNFDATHIHTGKDKLMNQLKKAKEMTSEQKQNIQMFIDNASIVLIDASDKSNNRSDVQGTWAQKKNNMVTSGGDHIIIANANTEAGKTADIAGGRIAGSSEVPPGWLNPINIRTVATCMNIDTRFRNLYQTTTSSDFQFDLPDIQKKVTHMRITNIDLPMSFYGVMRSRNDSTLVITEATKRSSLTMRTNEFNDYPMSDTNTNTDNTDSSYNTQTGQWSQEFVQSILKLHPCFSHIKYETDIPTIYSLIDTTDSNKMMVYQTYGAGSEWQSAKFFRNPEFSFGWLVTLPDGNYECVWQKSNNSADLEFHMNESLSQAMPGILFHSDGTFLAYSIDNTSQEPTIDYGMNDTREVYYSVNRASGKSMFTVPPPLSETSVFKTGRNVTSELNWPPNTTSQLEGFRLYFAVNAGGSLTSHDMLQQRLGWQLGFRKVDYFQKVSDSCISEGVAMISGPRYLFLSIDDGLKNYCNDFIAAFSQHSMHENVMTKINTAFSMDNVGVYKASSDNGLDNQYNRTRSYFGPGTITRLKIKLLDEYGRVVSLTNMDWSMSIVFDKLYD